MATEFNQEKFGKAWTKILELMSSMYGKFQASNLSTEAIIKELIDLDFKTLLLRDFKLNGELKAITSNYINTLRSMKSFAAVPEATLTSLIKMDIRFFSSKIGEQAEIMKRLMIESIIGRQSEAVFAESLLSTGMSERVANQIANDSLRRFSRTVTREMANNAPPDKLFIYEGPIDDRTSDVCLQISAAGPMTMASIDSRFVSASLGGGHFACRHEFVPYFDPSQYPEKDLRKQDKARGS